MESSEEATRNIQIAESLKEEGNRLFREGEYRNALKKYAHVFPYIEGLVSNSSEYAKYSKSLISSEAEQHVKDLKHTVLLNQAAVLCKLNEFPRAIEKTDKVKCRQAIEILRSSKALYRRATALIGSGNLKRARDDLTAAKELDPTNVGIDQLLSRLEKEEEDLEKELSKRFKGMFS